VKNHYQKLENVNVQLLSNKFAHKAEKLTLTLVSHNVSKILFFIKDLATIPALLNIPVQPNATSKNTENTESENTAVPMTKFVQELNVKESTTNVLSLV
jgi:hypothetical protein